MCAIDKFGSLNIACDDDKFGSLEVYRTICDDDKFGSLKVYTLCVMFMSLEAWKFTCCVWGW